ncbi:MAG: SMP-30/gluconolactonase/LRE family protein [Chloroflexi bacterium]|nr:SMP-30/gluconolactonase/LRE family protein [Chloroflexota bacterium]
MRIIAPGQVGLERVDALVDGLDHPEGVTYGADGCVYAGSETGTVYRINWDDRGVVEVGSTGGFVLGLALDADHYVYGCDSRRRAVFRMSPTGAVDTYSSGTRERPMSIPNYPVFDAAGNLYVSDSGSFPSGGGCVYRIAPGGRTSVWTEETRLFANGIALAPDGRSLYVVESIRAGVVRVPIRDDGSAGPLEVVVELPMAIPDGLAFDADGGLYIACYRPDRIYRLSASGQLEVVADDWTGHVLAAPTNLAFAGPGLRHLVFANLGRWHLGRLSVDVPGHPLRYPTLR